MISEPTISFIRLTLLALGRPDLRHRFNQALEADDEATLGRLQEHCMTSDNRVKDERFYLVAGGLKFVRNDIRVNTLGLKDIRWKSCLS